jgi:uncharacterized protein (DUF2141 family)
MRKLIIFTAALLIPLASHAEESTSAHGTLEIKITNIENGNGTIYIAIQDSAEGWLESDPDTKTYRDVTQPVSSTEDLLVNVEGLPPGEYAVSLFHDLDGDEELATNFIGYPKEPFGFSAPMGKFGPPKFSEAAVEFSGEDTSVEVRLN